MRLFLFLFAIVPASLFAQDATAIVKITSLTKDLGTVVKGKKVSNYFEFTNIADKAIEIDLVSTCECTEAKWTRGKILPGEKGKIDFIFDSSKKDKEETIDIDVYFLTINSKTGNPYSLFLQYTYHWAVD
jgi:hypothetical protein